MLIINDNLSTELLKHLLFHFIYTYVNVLYVITLVSWVLINNLLLLFGSVLVRFILVHFYEILITVVSIVLPSATYFISCIKIQY